MFTHIIITIATKYSFHSNRAAPSKPRGVDVANGERGGQPDQGGRRGDHWTWRGGGQVGWQHVVRSRC